MGLFESKEQKQLKKQQKEDEKAAEKAAKIRAKLAGKHLDSIDNEFIEDCADILYGLAGTGMMEFGSKLSSASTEDNLKITYLNTIMSQNWIMIRQLDRIIKALERE